MKDQMLYENNGSTLYQQIISYIEEGIAQQKFKRGDKLPSINKLCLAFSVSRDSVLLAYQILKKRGIVYSVLGKGYFVKSEFLSHQERYFLLFDELNAFKEDLYNSFLESINHRAQVEIFFHHFNLKMFQKLIDEARGNYTHYIIMPSNLVGVATFIKTLPKSDVYILDQTNQSLSEFSAIYQDFEKNMFDALCEGKHLLDKYQKLILIYPGFKEPEGMVTGFLKFVNEFNFENEILTTFEQTSISKGDVFVIPNDRDLVRVVEQGTKQQLVLGTDYGVISYNDTPLKKIVENGITTISTDFYMMGKTLAMITLNNESGQFENEARLIIRNSL
ncbi:MAG: GntR family transcriptional regulator [Flavobacterium sp.]